jgi:hypothetical protein
MTSFVAYVDESGDEGFHFLANESGSSRWLVLSAVVYRKENDLDSVALLKGVRERIGKAPRRALHFRFLKHEHRIPYARSIGVARVKIVSVAIYKPGIPNHEHYQREAHMLYRYACRLLVERISWLCADFKRPDDPDGKVELIFSNRSAMSYEDLRDYLTLLRDGPPSARCRIYWQHVDPEAVQAVNHDQLAGLQIADAIASGTFLALNLNKYGEYEPRYFELFHSKIYRSRGTSLGWGMKFWPDFHQQKETLDHLTAIERFL